jgi:hypothetical protein
LRRNGFYDHFSSDRTLFTKFSEVIS